jgi:eukaryotic-like serine/threonine-protein kinase
MRSKEADIETIDSFSDASDSLREVLTPPEGAGQALRLPTMPLSQRYQNPTEFARGGLGRILKAYDNRLARPVAIKELLENHQEEEERFLQEARIAAQLEHPSIIPVHDAGRWPSGAPFYTMKLISGRTLSAALQERATLTERLALLPHVLDACEAMAYAHSKQIIHRDLKPHNILIGEFGETVVIDWGLAKQLRADLPTRELTSLVPLPPQKDSLTIVGSIIGTPAYMPPEQARGEVVDARADVYALGAILYHLLAGTPPYTSRHAQLTIASVLAGAPLSLEERQPDIPRDLLAIVQKAMARDVRDRYQNAKQLAQDIKQFHTGQLVGAHHYSTRELFTRWVKRHRGTLLVSMLAVLLLVVGGVYSLLEINAKRQLAEEGQQQAMQGQGLAIEAEQKARRSLDDLRLEQARAAAEREPAKALALLALLSEDFPSISAARMIAETAIEQPTPVLLQGHTAPIAALLLTPDGDTLISAGDDAIIRVWNLACVRSNPESPDACPPRSLEGHQAWITHLALSADGKRLLSSGVDMSFFSWELSSGASTELVGHEGMVRTAIFSPDMRYIISSSADRTVRIWDASTHDLLRIIEADVFEQLVSPDGQHLAMSTTDFKILLWSANDLLTQPTPLTLIGHEGSPRLAFSPDSKYLASAGGDEQLFLWEVATATHVVSLHEHQDFIYTLQFSPDGKWLATAGDDKTVRLWDVACLLAPLTSPSKELCTRATVLLGHERSVLDLAFSPDSKYLVSSSNDRTVRLWDVEARQVSRVYPHQDVVWPMLFTNDGAALLSASFDSRIYLWDIREHRRTLRGQQSDLWGLAFSPDGASVATAGLDRQVRLWDTKTSSARVLPTDDDDLAGWGFGEDGRPFLLQLDPMYPLQFISRDTRFSPDGHWLASAGLDGRIYLWNIQSGARRVLRGHAKQVRRLEFSSDSRLLASTSQDGSACLWDVSSGRVLFDFSHEKKSVMSASFSPDGALLAVASAGSIRVFDTLTGAEQGRLRKEGQDYISVSFSPDGETLAYAGYDALLTLCQVKTGKCQSLEGHNMAIFSLSFSPDSKMIATGSQDETIRLWRVSTGESQVFRGHEKGVRKVLFSPNGKTLASISPDRTGRLWDIETGESRVLRGHTDSVFDIGFSPDGKTLATVSLDGSLRFWSDDLPFAPKALRAKIEAALQAIAL